MIYRIYATQDAFISNVSASGNCGQNPILRIGKRMDVDSNVYAYRSLLKFDINAITGWQSSGVIPSDASASNMDFYLKMFDVYHSGTYPQNFDVFAHLVTTDWDEGYGIEYDLSESGAVCWRAAKTDTVWTDSGGDFDNTISSSQHFDSGSEDLSMNISGFMAEWLDCTHVNKGLILKLSGSQETSGSGATSYDSKLFYGRNTVTNYEPYIEIRWDDTIKDDGATFVSFNPLYSSYDNYFYLYNSIHNKMYDFPNINTGSDTDLIFTIYDDSGSILAEETASWKEKGVWEGGPVTGNYTGADVLFYTASWASSGAAIRIDQIYSASLHDFDRAELYDKRYIVSIPNLRSTYGLNERAVFQVFVRPEYPSYSFASGNQDLEPTIMRYIYYEIRDAVTNEIIIPYHLIYTRLSYDYSGNYFRLFMQNLRRGKIYKIVFFADIDNSFVEYNDNWCFKIS